MENFDSIKNIWQQDKGGQGINQPKISPSSRNAKTKMQRQYLIGSLMLSTTGLFVLGMALFLDFGFQHWYTFGAMSLISFICFAQAYFLIQNYSEMKNISDTAPPLDHLKQWEKYYQLRKHRNRWNAPLYFISLNFALGIYFLEVLAGRPLVNILIFIGIYLVWMVFAYFVLGKRVLKKEEERLKTIMDDLKSLSEQFEDNR